jgi:hypothetical protein
VSRGDRCTRVDVPNPITQLVLLEELFGQILDVSFRQVDARVDGYGLVAITSDLDAVPELSGASVDLDAVVEEFLEGGTVENAVTGRFREVDDELVLHAGLRLARLGGGLGGGLGLKEVVVSLLRSHSAKRRPPF